MPFEPTNRADISNEAVERFYINGTEEKNKHGDWVHYIDYAALSARMEELERENWRLKREVNHQKIVNECGDAIGGFDHEALEEQSNEGA